MTKELKSLSGKTVLVTGSAGFIGFHLSKKLLESGVIVVGLDNFNNYYDTKLKEDRNKILKKFENYKIYRCDLTDSSALANIFRENKIDKVVNLAAQAGVRYSLTNPCVYASTNVVGFVNLLNEMAKAGVNDFVYASSSSVYGNEKTGPISVFEDADKPVSLYAATKRADEIIAYSYNKTHGINCTGLRFFTVYGPYGRPDMAYFSFTKKIFEGEKVEMYNSGNMSRDFTYIDDIISGIILAMHFSYSYEIFNLGSSSPINLKLFIELLEKKIGKTVSKKYLPMQKGDVVKTFADIDYSKEKLGFNPKFNINLGISRFVDWYKKIGYKYIS